MARSSEAICLVAFAREDQRQRDGAVEQVRAARLAGSLRRARHVEHVVEQLESEPDPPGELAERAASPAVPSDRHQRAEPAGGLEQRRGLQSAALEIALDRDVRRVRVLALQQLAGGERRARVGEGAAAARGPVAGQLGKRAREEQVACGDRRLTSRFGRHRGPPAAQLSAVDQVVVDERGRVHELDGHSGAHQALLALGVPPPGPPADSAASTTSSGRSRLPPAAIVALHARQAALPASAVTFSR